MPLSKDKLSGYDPCIKTVRVKNGFINLLLHQNTVVLTFSEQELNDLIKLLQEQK